MPTFAGNFRAAVAILNEARVDFCIASDESAEWLIDEYSTDPGTTSDACLLVNKTELPRAISALTSAGMSIQPASGITAFLANANDDPSTAVRLITDSYDAALQPRPDHKQLADTAFTDYLERRKTPVAVTAAQELDTLIACHIAPGLKAVGFKKNRRLFHRRIGSVVHVIEIRGSWTSDRHEAQFTIELGIWSDDINALAPESAASPLPRSGVPTLSHCHLTNPVYIAFAKWRGTEFKCIADHDNAEIARKVMQAIFDDAIPLFDNLTSTAAIFTHVMSESPRLSVVLQTKGALLRLCGTPEQFDAFAAPFRVRSSEQYQPDIARRLARLRSRPLPNKLAKLLETKAKRRCRTRKSGCGRWPALDRAT